MKTIKKVLLVICVITIAIGMFILGRQGLNYVEGYSQNILLETVKDYALYVGIATALILIYFVIKYIKQGIVKVAVTSILTLVATIAFVLSIIAIIKMPVTRIIIPIMLVSYISSLILLSAHFERNT